MGSVKISILILSIILWIVLLGQESLAAVVDKDLTLTSKQKVILNKFKIEVSPIVPHEYMKEDIYLIKWLRAKNFNIAASRQMLMENLQWRKKNRMDTIHDENWSDFESRYKVVFDGVDKVGRPILYLPWGSWDLRKAVLSGERDNVTRYLDKAIDFQVRKIRKLQSEGKIITQYDFIANIGGYSITQHGCIQCLPIYTNFVSSYENHFPGMANKIVLVNFPSVFETILNAVRPLMSPITREALKTYGASKLQYEDELFKDIDRNQLPPQVGGTEDGTIYGDKDPDFIY